MVPLQGNDHRPEGAKHVSPGQSDEANRPRNAAPGLVTPHREPCRGETRDHDEMDYVLSDDIKTAAGFRKLL